MPFSSRRIGFLFAAILFSSCVAVSRTSLPVPAPDSGMGTLAAKHEPVTTTNALIVIPKDWKMQGRFAARYPELDAADGAHIVDLAAIRFQTDPLVSVSGNGQRVFAMPDLSTFAPELDTAPFGAGSEDYFIVQAASPGKQSDLRAWLEQNGIAILDYLPQLAYLVRASDPQIEAIEQRAEVFWAGLYSPAFRVDPQLEFVIDANPSQRIQFRILFDADRIKDLQPVLDQLTALGLSKPQFVRRSRDWSVRVEGNAETARKIALLPGCLWVERFVMPELQNNTARSSQNIVTGRGALSGPIMDVEDVWARGIRGEGQIASAADTGLSTGNLSTLHQDFGQQGSGTNPMRVLAGYALGRPGNWNDDQTIDGGHGTHTSGSIVGNGFRSGSTPSTNTFPTTSFAGTAPKAQFVFQSIMDSGGNLGGIPLDLNTLFQQTYNDGARVHSNSWGSNVSGAYTAEAQEVDQFSWRNKDMVITFSAGNAGKDTASPTDGVINTDSIGSPGTAKNCITVGASENYRPDFIYEFPSGDCTSSNGIEQKTWGWFNATNFSTAPIFGDLMADNASGMGAFSSRGPTDDGRFKPDVVAPGIAIISTRTDVNQAYEQWGICSIPVPQRPYYMTMGGTSMSNPLTAGAATLLRQYYVDGWHANNSDTTNGAATPADGFNPTSALVKATLINGAWDMNPGQYGTGSTREIVPSWDTGKTLPNNVEGYGRVDVEKSLFPGSGWQDSATRKLKVHDVTTGLSTGQNSNFTFDVGGNGDPLIVTLVWTDPQGAVSAGTELVNNLDLTVSSPGGVTTYFPNGVDKTTGVDNLNNVEQVKITNPTAGTWTITVAATNVPGNAESGSTAQPFALVISGQGCNTAPSIPAGVTATATTPNTINVSWSASTGSPVSYRVYRAGPGSSCPTGGYAPIAVVTAPIVTYDDVGVSAGSTYSYKVAAVGATCESQLSSCSSATPSGVCTLPPVFAGLVSVVAPNNASCVLNLSWAGATPSCSAPVTYNIYRSTSPGFTPAPSNRIATGVSGTAYSDVTTTTGTTYYYKVRAVENGIEETNNVQQSGAPAGVATVLYNETFDALPSGNLAGFTTAGTGTANWRGVMTCSPNHSASNVFRFGGAGCTSAYSNSANTQAILNGASGIAIPAGAASVRLNFWHRWVFEDTFDGGYLSIRRSTDGVYTRVPASAILSGAYNNTVSSGTIPVWGGETFNTTMTNSIVDLDAACNAISGNTGGCANKTIFISFNAFTDSSLTFAGWSIDDVKVSYEVPCTNCTPPGTPIGLALTTPSNNAVHLAWSSGAPAGVSYNVYRETGSCPVTTPALIASGITATSYDDTGLAGATTYRYVVRAVSANGCESASSGCQSTTTTGPALPAPGIVATATGTTSVGIVWGSVDGAASYVVERSADNTSYATVGITAGTAMSDTGRSSATSYLYRAYALTSAGGSSAAGNKDAATTVIFTDDPLLAGTTIKAAHITQLRTAVDAMRVLAGLGGGSYTDPTITPGTTLAHHLHVSELRSNLDAARSTLGLAALIYADPTLTAGTLIKATHVQEVREGTK